MASPTFTHVFAALIAVVNTKFPQIGELVLKRLINEFRKAFRRNQKDRCLASARFLAHLVNQKISHELIVLELLTLLLEQTTDDSVEVSVAVLKECGAYLSRVVPKGVLGIFDHLRRILNESDCDKRIAYMLEVMFQIRRDGWKDHPTVLPELDLIEEDDQITHTLSLLDPVDPEDSINVFHFDPDFLANEEKYNAIRTSFLGAGEIDGDESGSGEGSDAEGDDEDEEGENVTDRQQHGAAVGADQQGVIIDQTETNLVHLRRTIYLMLQSSVSADEAAHRLLQLKIKPGEEYEVASMVLDCCAQTRSYESRYGRLAQRLCRVLLFTDQGKKDESATGKKDNETKKGDEKSTEPPRTYVSQFEKIFGEQYAVIHRLETAKLRNVALFFAHLLFTDSISWGVLECISLNERDTTSSGRIFLKHMFLELCSYMGLGNLQTRLRDPTLQQFFGRLLPRDNPKDTRFAINFLTTIGLGGLTLDLREFLQNSKQVADKQRSLEAALVESSASSSTSSSSSSEPSSSSSSSSSDSDSSDSECKPKRKSKRIPTVKDHKDKKNRKEKSSPINVVSSPKSNAIAHKKKHSDISRERRNSGTKNELVNAIHQDANPPDNINKYAVVENNNFVQTDLAYSREKPRDHRLGDAASRNKRHAENSSSVDYNPTSTSSENAKKRSRSPKPSRQKSNRHEEINQKRYKSPLIPEDQPYGIGGPHALRNELSNATHRDVNQPDNTKSSATVQNNDFVQGDSSYSRENPKDRRHVGAISRIKRHKDHSSSVDYNPTSARSENSKKRSRSPKPSRQRSHRHEEINQKRCKSPLTPEDQPYGMGGQQALRNKSPSPTIIDSKQREHVRDAARNRSTISPHCRVFQELDRSKPLRNKSPSPLSRVQSSKVTTQELNQRDDPDRSPFSQSRSKKTEHSRHRRVSPSPKHYRGSKKRSPVVPRLVDPR